MSTGPEATATVTLPGVVETVIKSPNPAIPDKAQISVEGADHLYREIRIENILETDKGEKVKLKPGATVDVTIAAPETDTTAK
jgi:hypothetical protein